MVHSRVVHIKSNLSGCILHLFYTLFAWLRQWEAKAEYTEDPENLDLSPCSFTGFLPDFGQVALSSCVSVSHLPCETYAPWEIKRQRYEEHVKMTLLRTHNLLTPTVVPKTAYLSMQQGKKTRHQWTKTNCVFVSLFRSCWWSLLRPYNTLSYPVH